MNENYFETLEKIQKDSQATSCVSIICPKMDIGDLRYFVRNEARTAENIKNNSNRKAVTSGLTRIGTFLKATKEIPDNGIAMYAHSYI